MWQDSNAGSAIQTKFQIPTASTDAREGLYELRAYMYHSWVSDVNISYEDLIIYVIKSCLSKRRFYLIILKNQNNTSILSTEIYFLL